MKASDYVNNELHRVKLTFYIHIDNLVNDTKYMPEWKRYNAIFLFSKSVVINVCKDDLEPVCNVHTNTLIITISAVYF